MIRIKISDDYSMTPGGRYKKEGAYSGEDFRERLLLPKFLKAVEENDQLEIDLDGGYGYATSFLEEAFGGLARKLKSNNISTRIKIISRDEPGLIEDIFNYIERAND